LLNWKTDVIKNWIQKDLDLIAHRRMRTAARAADARHSAGNHYREREAK